MNENLTPDDSQASEAGEAFSMRAASGDRPPSPQEPSTAPERSGAPEEAQDAGEVAEAARNPVNAPEEIAPEGNDEAAASEEPTPENSPESRTEPETGLPAESEAEEEETAPVWVPEPDKLLCALLFASHEYLNARALREIMGEEWDTPRLRQLVKKINRDLEAGEQPFEVVEVEGTFRIRTRPVYFPWTRKLFKESMPRRLSQAALETLAIVAYKQPITKAEIESIRGVNVDGSLKTLLDKRLIDIGRRSDSLGQAFTYHTTREFLRYFGINRMPDDLPRLSEFEGILNAQSLIPQMGMDGEVHEVTRPEEPEQLSLGMGQEQGSERE